MQPFVAGLAIGALERTPVLLAGRQPDGGRPGLDRRSGTLQGRRWTWTDRDRHHSWVARDPTADLAGLVAQIADVPAFASDSTSPSPATFPFDATRISWSRRASGPGRRPSSRPCSPTPTTPASPPSSVSTRRSTASISPLHDGPRSPRLLQSRGQTEGAVVQMTVRPIVALGNPGAAEPGTQGHALRRRDPGHWSRT